MRRMQAVKREIRLVIFDLDGTLTPVDSLWRYLHDRFGTWDQGKLAADKYRSGQISYKEWAEADARFWSGVAVSRIDEMLKEIPYRQGAREVFRALRQRNIRTAIISAGLSVLADKAANELGADVALSNGLQTNNGRLTGGITVKVAVNEKHQIVRQIASQLSVSLDQVALVGDRFFDLSNPECLKIAFKPKDELARKQADFVVEDDDLSSILHYLI